jgi:DNA polymerase III subunit epsilon
MVNPVKMGTVMIKIELPPKYYLDHFREFRAMLEKQYGQFFDDHHRCFLSDFDSLSEDGQCLYLRLMNRRGRFFFTESLQYQEITSFDEASRELLGKGFISLLNENHWNDFLPGLSKIKLVELAEKNSVQIKKSWSREKIKEELRVLPFSPFEDVLVQDRREELQYLLFLFFGKIQDNLSLYTLRDLGVRKSNKQKETFISRFQNKEEALSHYFYARLAEDISTAPPIEAWPATLNRDSFDLREEILLAISEEYKAIDDIDGCIQVLSHCRAHPGREKRVRLLFMQNRKEEALEILNQILEEPYSDVEYLFAEDYLARKYNKQKQSILTKTLREARKVSIDESYFRHPEMGVIDYLKSLGQTSFHVENYLWNSLFGLLFWEELFESEKTAIFNEFERRPKDLDSIRFFELHEERIFHKLEILSTDYILGKIEEKKDIQNGVFGWYENLSTELELFLTKANLQSVKDMLVYLTKDFNKRNSGFPDLVAYSDEGVKFYEIKAEGDSLKQLQLLQILALKKAGFEVEILQVEYAFNPEQLYVVVDIETTGGSLPYHRVTELGAVKMRNGEVIDRYQTLVNPERWISREIEALTGISNELVKTAPKFAEVADAFHEFTKDAIFVAHNVSFDYGFIQAEFEKLEKRFVRPYICTKAGMKKQYPDLESYSLKNLTAHFGISLETHHRALCDAEAAAGLLKLINLKRREKASKV